RDPRARREAPRLPPARPRHPSSPRFVRALASEATARGGGARHLRPLPFARRRWRRLTSHRDERSARAAPRRILPSAPRPRQARRRRRRRRFAAMTRAEAKTRIAALSAEIREHGHRYHVLDRPTISDAQYDRMFKELQALEEEFPDLRPPDSPTLRVGAAPR